MALSLFCGRGYKCATEKGQGLSDALTGEAMQRQTRRGRTKRLLVLSSSFLVEDGNIYACGVCGAAE